MIGPVVFRQEAQVVHLLAHLVIVCNLLMTVTPWVTSGITTRAQIR
ncbi:MAG: hypothetical protein K0M39_01550 [Rhizobium sp.]|nr:hypothetical protein [Rhizobium sp.]